MADKKLHELGIFSILGIVFGFVPLIIFLGILINTYVIQTAWKWFIVSQFNVDPLSFKQSLAVCVTIGVFGLLIRKTKFKSKKERDEEKEQDKQTTVIDAISFILAELVLPIIFLGFLFVLKAILL